VRKVSAARPEVSFVPKHSFDDFKLSERLRKNVAGCGYDSPTPIQDQGIIPIAEGKDLIGLANTGTGKTAAFLLPIMQKLEVTKAREAVLIIVPTRELAGQIADEFRIYSHGLNLTAVVCVGGAPIKRQIMQLKKEPNIIIGTPGRLKDLAKQRKLRLDRIQTFILDEADQMMDMGFIPDIRAIVAYLPQKRQTLCFSATLPPKIDKLVEDLMTNPVTISVRTGVTSDNVDQDVLYANDATQKIEVLTDLFKKEEFSKVLIFGKTKHGVQRLSDALRKADFRVDAIHGNKSQNQRQKALQDFKTDKIRILVATDVAARGIDIPLVSHVINFDQPNTYEDYIHRIGRTGRAGHLGKALTFVSAHTRVN
jgi:superfamily II DNA/RNA helicase